MKKYDYYHILNQRGVFVVKGYDTHPRHSVLAGQTRINYLDSFDTYEEAAEAYPEATDSNAYVEPVNTFGHLDDTEGSW